MLTLVVVLYVDEGREALAAAYEAFASAVMREHGGSIVRAVRCAEHGLGEQAPFEVHVGEFSSHEALAAYRDDERIVAARPRREAAIRKTVVFAGHDVAPPGA
jgi:uncharacterized protein (DUF1330 family)